jgi:PAS domain S-box-containing protein
VPTVTDQPSAVLDALLDATTDAVVRLDSEETVTLWDGDAERLFGWGEAEVLGDGIPVIPESAREDAPELATLADGATRRAVAVTRRTADGSPVPAELTARPVDGAPGALCTYRDVAERDRLREEYQTYRRRLDGAMFAGDLAWWEMDVETGSVQFHDNKAQMLGYAPERFDHYEDFTDLVHPDDYEGAMEAMRAHYRGDATKYDVEYRIRTADGDYRWFHDVGGITRRTREGDPEKVTGIVVDITRRKTQEEELQKRAEQLSVLNRIVRHDIHNDMTVVTGWLELLREDIPPELRERLDRVLETGRHVIEFTDAVSDLMELLEEGGDFALKPVDLRPVLELEVERVDTAYADAEIGIVGEIPAATVRANDMLSSVFRNLLNNAVQHNDEETPRVEVRAGTGAETVTVRVADNGPGVPPDRREDIFGRNEKGLASDGTGVGLYLVDRLVDAYGGGVRIEDNDPEGAVFVVELPAA